MSVVLSILIMIAILSVLTVVHEWGHFIVARLFKVKVNEFSIFMGPKLFQRKLKKTGMLFSIRALPFGGYCALEGEVDDGAEDGKEKEEAGSERGGDCAEEGVKTEADKKASFFNKPWYVRACILIAGVTMNYILAVIIVSLIFAFNGYDTRKISAVSDDTPMAIAGLEIGDEIIQYNGKNIVTPADYSVYNIIKAPDTVYFTVKKKDGTKVKYGFERNFDVVTNEGEDSETNPGTITAEVKVFSLSGRKYETRTELGTYYAYWDNNRSLKIRLSFEDGRAVKYYYGEVNGAYVSQKSEYVRTEDGTFAGYTEELTGQHENLSDEEYAKAVISEFAQYGLYEKYGFSFTYGYRGNFFQVIGHSIMYVHSLIKSVFLALWYLITGKLGLSALSGPIGITNIVNTVVSSPAAGSGVKFAAIAEMTALISANLAVVNLLPIPGLDGGKLLFIVIELIRGGKKVPAKVEGILSMIFFGLLILLAVIVAGNDIVNIFKGNLFAGTG